MIEYYLFDLIHNWSFVTRNEIGWVDWSGVDSSNADTTVFHEMNSIASNWFANWIRRAFGWNIAKFHLAGPID